MEQFRHVGSGQLLLKFGLPRLEFEQLALDRNCGNTVFDRLYELADLLFHHCKFVATLGNLRSVLHAEAIELLHVLLAEFREQVTPHQLVTNSEEHSRFELGSADRPSIGARAARPRVETRQALLPVHHVPTATFGTPGESGEDEFRPPRTLELLWVATRQLPSCSLASLDRAPEFIVDDPQLGDVSRHPLRRRIEARDAFACVGIFQVSKAVPNDPADVQLVIQNARAANNVSMDRTWVPTVLARAGDALRVQSFRDRFRRLS
ncbi:MAG TPA: hypothetical protein VEP46_02290 [Vicinamibacterales bacterium]|nr:hypothetical protein [Vicinamibacterales bacterium]